MTRLIAAGPRAWIDPAHIKFVSWRTTRQPFTCHETGEQMAASVTVETYHATHRIACTTSKAAQTLAELLIAEAGAENLGASLHTLRMLNRDAPRSPRLWDADKTGT